MVLGCLLYSVGWIRFLQPTTHNSQPTTHNPQQTTNIHQSNSVAGKTGPSVHANRYAQSFPALGGEAASFFFTLMQQLWHVPMPQAIARSTAIWQGMENFAAISATRFIIGSGPQV
jgi:hypothetical protein